MLWRPSSQEWHKRRAGEAEGNVIDGDFLFYWDGQLANTLLMIMARLRVGFKARRLDDLPKSDPCSRMDNADLVNTKEAANGCEGLMGEA